MSGDVAASKEPSRVEKATQLIKRIDELKHEIRLAIAEEERGRKRKRDAEIQLEVTRKEWEKLSKEVL